MLIKTFAQRQKIGEIYKTLFDYESDLNLSWQLFDTIDFACDIGSTDMLEERLENIGNKMYDAMNEFDKKEFKKLG